MRAAFLTNPGAWIRAARTDADPIRDACAIEAPKRRAVDGERIASVLLATAIGVLLAWAGVYGWSLR